MRDGRRFRLLCVVDDFSRECLACVVDTSIGGVRVVRELERLVMERGAPRVIVSDNGCELTSTAVLRWSLGRLDWAGSTGTYRAGQTRPERFRRVLQQPLARRVPQRACIPQPGRGAGDHRCLA